MYIAGGIGPKVETVLAVGVAAVTGVAREAEEVVVIQDIGGAGHFTLLSQITVLGFEKSLSKFKNNIIEYFCVFFSKNFS